MIPNNLDLWGKKSCINLKIFFLITFEWLHIGEDIFFTHWFIYREWKESLYLCPSSNFLVFYDSWNLMRFHFLEHIAWNDINVYFEVEDSIYSYKKQRPCIMIYPVFLLLYQTVIRGLWIFVSIFVSNKQGWCYSQAAWISSVFGKDSVEFFIEFLSYHFVECY